MFQYFFSWSSCRCAVTLILPCVLLSNTTNFYIDFIGEYSVNRRAEKNTTQGPGPGVNRYSSRKCPIINKAQTHRFTTRSDLAHRYNLTNKHRMLESI